MSVDVVIVNTLGGALKHYTASLKDSLEAGGAGVTVLSILEPSQTGGGSLRWLRDYVQVLARARRSVRGRPAKILVTWPLLGYVDVVLLRFTIGRRAAVVIHDTRPLVAARGYGALYQRVAAILGRSVDVIVHSRQAVSDIDFRPLAERVLLVPHPVSEPHPVTESITGRPIVRALGQFKPDRDVHGLQTAAVRLRGSVDLSIVGRNWPAVEGWEVRSEFVPEEELEELIRSSSAVVIPYKRFYQSGIAFWCLELGTPVVGPAGTSLEEVLGVDSRLLIRDLDGWGTAVAFALSQEGRDSTRQAAADWRRRSNAEWASWATT
jgi:glycosyltransferase involved in cell wall biosynthesis